MNSKTERVAIVTGSGRGLGAATALRLAQDGNHIVINDLNAEAAKETASKVEALGRSVLISNHDVSDPKAVAALIQEVTKKFGRIDVLVNNAGITRDAMLSKMTEDQWDAVIKVNLKGPYLMGQAVSAVMKGQSYGRIINIASVAWLGNIGQSNYSASKAGIVGMTKTWALELARIGVTVNAVAPGFIDTAMTQAVPPEVREKFVQRIPLKRMGSPDDIANMVAFFASELSGYVTGQVIQVDGGLSTGISF